MILFTPPQGPEPKLKARTINILKQNVYDNIDRITQKRSDISDIADVKIKDAISSDTSESLDGAVISEHVEFRDAKLRKRLQLVLEPEEVLAVDDTIEAKKESFCYRLNLPESISDNILKPLARAIHRYLVYGALFDWYSDLGLLQQASVYEATLKDIEEEIVGALKGPSIAKRPAQPFGPASKTLF